ncbi:phospholipase D family protein [Pseudidiomarina sediminum]|uniref:phospholipase D family protein n=1 Tax=Pseudidiomarina sediminum TaxID=431675 RepID=UPI001C945F26|nr:phospholipase D family protein [Pseudidiomarina sediminum]MBY6063687.1 phospholipase D family protein [Pseudidiomarina sediminum]
MRSFRFLLVLVLSLTTAACSGLPDLEAREPSFAVPAAETLDTRLGQLMIPLLNQAPTTDAGIVLLGDAQGSLEARMMLVEQADVSLDIQYYIWRDDVSGQLVSDGLLRAAERGVRVRLLLDDFHTRKIEGTLSSLNAHPNIEVRLFNPITPRGSIALGFIFDFNRANRRMHNKSFTADNQATIVGGRNIGDDYFIRSDGVLFADLDVLVMGETVTDISNDFDVFWNSDSAYPFELITDPSPRSENKAVIKDFALGDISTERFFDPTLITWAETEVVSDDPIKALGEARSDQLITHALKNAIGEPVEEVLLVSPYFIPRSAGVKALEQVLERGVKISVLTNAYATNDVAIVHSGYAKWRERLLKAGIHLYELRPSAFNDAPMEYDSVDSSFSSSASSLHAKTFIIDRQRVFVGSFNFDPRSVNLNTELGVVIDSPELAATMSEAFHNDIRQQAYEVKLSETGELYWLERNGEELKRHDTEPGMSWFERFSVGFFSFLPIDWLL